MNKNEWRPGRWKVVGDISGLTFWSDEVVTQWDGMVDHPRFITERHPQDLIRSRPESGVPWARPESDPVFTNGTNDGSDL